MISNRVRHIGPIFLSLCFVTLALILLPHPALAAELSQHKIDMRFQQISQTYSPGEELSEQDAAFVRRYATRPEATPNPGTRAGSGSKNVNASRTMYGVTAKLSGNVWHSGTFTYQWGATLTGRILSGSTPRSMTASAKVQAYGATTSGGLSLAYTRTLSNTSYNSRTVQMSKSDSYAGLVVAYYVTSQLDVTTSSGSSFTVQSNW